MTFRLFISSVQSEFAAERRRLADYIRQDALLGRFFVPFLFEETPACDASAQQVYLDEVKNCDLYVCLIGRSFGNEVSPRLSATEREYDLATELSKPRLAFVRASTDREPNEQRFLAKIESSVIRKSFETYDELQLAVYASLVRFLEQRGFVRIAPFDLAFDSGLTLADLDDSKISEFLARAREAGKISVPSDADAAWLLSKLDAVRSDGCISNAAVLLFAKEPQRKFQSSAVKCLHYWGTHVERPIPSYKIFEGGLVAMIENALEFVMSRVDRTIGIPDERGVAAAQDELPRLAVREAIVNAVCHRDYESTGSVQVMLFKDRLEIINAGSLPRGWTAANLITTHDSRPRNETLAKALDWAGFVERSGHGTEFIIEKCEASGLKTPEYRADCEDFHAIIWRKNLAPESSDLVQDGHKTGTRCTKNVPSECTKNGLSSVDIKLRILNFCRDADRAASEIQSLIGLANHTRFKRQWLDPLLDDNLLSYTVPDKPKSRYQKYRLTPKGTELLKGGAK